MYAVTPIPIVNTPELPMLYLFGATNTNSVTNPSTCNAAITLAIITTVRR